MVAAAFDPRVYPHGVPQILGADGRPIRPDGDARPGGISIPHVATFIARVEGGGNNYLHDRFDEALRHAREDAEVMRRDAYLMALLQERQLAVSSLPWHLEVPDEKDPYQMQVKDGLQRLIRGIPMLRRIIRWLLEAIWYGRYGVHVQWGWTQFIDRPRKKGQQQPGAPPMGMPGMPAMPGMPPPEPQEPEGKPRRGLTVRRAVPINGDKIGYQFDHTPYVLVSPGQHEKFPDSMMTTTSIGGSGLLLRGTWRERVIIHKHLMEDVDFFNPEQAAAIHGVGIRSKLFWLNWLKLEWLGNVTDFFDRIGMGVMIWRYPAGNDQAKRQAEEAAKNQSSRAHILVPVWGEAGSEALTGLDRVDVPMAGSEALVKLIDYVDKQLERYVVGQSGSSRAQSQGIGNEAASEFMQDCVPVDGSEILTRDGFKTAHDVQIGEEVLAYDVGTGTCRWTPLLDKTFYDDRPISRLYTKKGRWEAFCTADHSWACERHTYAHALRRTPENGFEVGHRGKLRGHSRRSLVKAHSIKGADNIVLAAPLDEGDVFSVLTPLEASILGWAVTDGTIQMPRNGGTMRRLGICQSKEVNFDTIRVMLERYDPPLYEWVGEPTIRTFPNGRTYACKPQHWWYLSSKKTEQLLQKCGFDGRHSLPGIVTQLSHGARVAMLDAMMLAEGTYNGVFYNKDPHILEAFEILCALEGFATGKTLPKSDTTAFAKQKKKTRRLQGATLRLEDAGRADIWCPTTKYGTWVMRQGGRVMITGNTKRAITLHDAHLLSTTLTGTEDDPGLVNTMKYFTYPDADFPVWWVFDVERPESEKKLNAVRTLSEMGVKVKEDEVLAAAGFSKPSAGDAVVQTPQQPGMGPPGMGGPPMPGGMPGMDPGMPPDAGQPGDFMQALQMMRDGYPMQYDWVNRGLVRVSATGLPMFRWWDTETQQARVQSVKPGSGRGQNPKSNRSPKGTGGSDLDLGRKTRALLSRVLAIMFPDRWVRLSGLPALCGGQAGEAFNADVDRDSDGALILNIRHLGEAHQLTLQPDGYLIMTLSGQDALERASHALAVAGIDQAVVEDQEVTIQGGQLPPYIQRGNEKRRQFRLANAEELMDEADKIIAVPEEQETEPPENSTSEVKNVETVSTFCRNGFDIPTVGLKEKVAKVVRYLRERGQHEQARQLVLAYAKRGKSS